MALPSRVLRQTLLAVAFGIAAISTASGAVADGGTVADLVVVIEGLESSRGQVRIAVFDSARSWLETAAFAKVVEINERACEWTFKAVPVGDYGIAVFHDVNGNGMNDRNFIGIPKEPYGFSNNVRAGLGPPKWSKAAFPVTSSRTEIRIEVR